MLTLDSNVLVYALDARDPDRSALARHLIDRVANLPSFLTQQVIGEFCAVAVRKRLLPASAIVRQVTMWSTGFAIVPTTTAQLLAAADLANRRQKQFWDMVIVRVAADAGATVLMTEDIGDGEVIAGVRIVNPFASVNAAAVAAFLTPAS